MLRINSCIGQAKRVVCRTKSINVLKEMVILVVEEMMMMMMVMTIFI
jgi:hypothetical protein